MFDTHFYNTLLSVSDADAAFVDRERLFSKLAPLFAREEYKNRYAVCLVHHHFKLNPGERMVSTGLITLPEQIASPPDPLIAPERWTAAGEPFEFRRFASESKIIPPPPPHLFTEFREAVGDVRVLGISLAGQQLAEGQIYWETTDNVDTRAHVLEVKDLSDVEQMKDFFRTCWRPEWDGSGTVMACCSVCSSLGHLELDE